MALLVLVLCACGGPPPPPPTAVIVAEPPSLCEGDGHATPVLLDGRDSAARLTLVPVPPDPDAPPLTYEWSFQGAEHRVVDGDLGSDHLTITAAADRPLHVTLRVTNELGGVAESIQTVGITRPTAGPAVACGSDRDCGPCRRCEDRVCVRREP